MASACISVKRKIVHLAVSLGPAGKFKQVQEGLEASIRLLKLRRLTLARSAFEEMALV
jgi:hypothetical protein